MYEQDGQWYPTQADAPDMGSLVCTHSNFNGGYREYVGLSADVDKLPHYKNLLSFSFCLFVDTSDVYMYHKPSDGWYPL